MIAKKRSTQTKITLWLVLLMAFPVLMRAQDFKVPPDVEKLRAKATETVEVTMDGPMLHWASKFLSADDPDEEKAAKLVANLRGIYVRTFEFGKEGAYTPADLESIRSLYRTPPWSKVVGVRSQNDGDNVDIFFKLENEKMAGIVIIAAEAQELTFVSIDGPLEIDQLADLGGDFGIPRLDGKTLKHERKADKGKDKEKDDKGKDDKEKDKDKDKGGQK